MKKITLFLLILFVCEIFLHLSLEKNLNQYFYKVVSSYFKVYNINNISFAVSKEIGPIERGFCSYMDTKKFLEIEASLNDNYLETEDKLMEFNKLESISKCNSILIYPTIFGKINEVYLYDSDLSQIGFIHKSDNPNTGTLEVKRYLIYIISILISWKMIMITLFSVTISLFSFIFRRKK